MTDTAPRRNPPALHCAYRLAHTALGRLIIELRRNGHEDAADACTFALDMMGKAVTKSVNEVAA